MFAFFFEFVCPFCKFYEKDFLSLDPFSYYIELRECLLFFCFKFRDPGYLINDLPALEIAHLHNTSYITLHHDIVTMRDNTELREMIDDIALFAKTVVEIVIAVISVSCPFDPAPDLRPIRKLNSNFRSVFPGIKIYEIGKLFCAQVTGTGKSQNEKNRINDIAFTRSVGAGYYGETL